jgi:hypothetical protein
MGKQIGIMVVKNGKVIGLEMAGHPDTFNSLKTQIYQKYAIDLAAKSEKVDVDTKTLLTGILKELRDGHVEMGEADQNIGGQNVFVETPELRGSFFQRGNMPVYVSIVRK